jgi:hypothetical protein
MKWSSQPLPELLHQLDTDSIVCTCFAWFKHGFSPALELGFSIKKSRIKSFAGKQIELEITMLSQIK